MPVPILRHGKQCLKSCTSTLVPSTVAEMFIYTTDWLLHNQCGPHVNMSCTRRQLPYSFYFRFITLISIVSSSEGRWER